MFVRCKKRFKDGKVRRYWSVVENVRVSGGRVVQRQVLYLGEINDIRIREAGSEHWSFGLETRITSCTFVDLKPDTEYALKIRAKNAQGEGPPTCVRMRANPAGAASNVIPFPKR